MVRIGVTLPPIRQIEKLAVGALRKSLNGTLTRAARNIELKTRGIIETAIVNTPEYRSINGGTLQGELGLPSPTLLDDIINQWVNTVRVNVRPVRFGVNQISGGFTLVAIPSDWSDVLSNPSSKITTEKGDILPWLEWLLTFGNRVIIKDYDVTFKGVGARRGRTGKAIMVKGRGKRWRVPPEFSGTSNDNFVTRALSAQESVIVGMIQKEVLKQVK